MGKVNTYITAADGQRIEFTLDRGRRRTAALAINEGRLTVRVPERASADDIRKFIEGHLEWIEKNLELSAKSSGLPRRFEDGEQMRLLGEWLTITAVKSDRYFRPKTEDGKLLVAVCSDSSREYMARQVQTFIIETADREITESMQRLTALMGLYPKKVTVKDLSASWGRCNSKGNISINYKVVTYSKAHIDYVCIHELSHLVHMDHSSAFWGLVEKYCPDWRSIRGSMRINSDEDE
ncbi:SprT family zinc-dependent metalloprotease [Ruminococcus sp.]|uniref:M48 family metallopeptidase n=1 Tax=Ruminococcus sp. TaxID=41978 RepID=UPI0025E1E644|nr:SprT family zinc-dependent metalloprotease [Ruminococcus sp.]MBQ8966532.1 M48 family metallopeptidase [Ruminococcus sp.]